MAKCSQCTVSWKKQFTKSYAQYEPILTEAKIICLCREIKIYAQILKKKINNFFLKSKKAKFTQMHNRLKHKTKQKFRSIEKKKHCCLRQGKKEKYAYSWPQRHDQ